MEAEVETKGKAEADTRTHRHDTHLQLGGNVLIEKVGERRVELLEVVCWRCRHQRVDILRTR